MADIPLAVSPTVRTPGTFLSVDLKAGAPSPGTGTQRALIIGLKSSSGTITEDTQLVQGVSGEAQVSDLFGPGTPTHLGAKRLFEEYGIAQVDVVCAAAASGSAATGTITFASSPTADRVITGTIAGRVIKSDWYSGETAIQGATRLVTQINAQGNDLPVTAANGGGTLAVVTLTFKHNGAVGNDCYFYAEISGSGAGSVTASASKLSGAAAEPSWVNALALAAGREYHIILICASNADTVTATTTGAPGRLKTHIELYKTGIFAKLQSALLGCTDATNASLKTGAAAQNYERLDYVIAREGQSLPFEFACAEAGSRLREQAKNPNRNRIGTVYVSRLYGPKSLVSGMPSGTEVEDDLQSGIGCIAYDESGRPFVTRPITSYFKTAQGAADDRVLDVPRRVSTDYVARDLATFIETSWPNMNIIDTTDVLEGQDFPEGCVTIQEISDGVAGRMEAHILRGIVRRSKFKEALDNGSFVCRINPTDGGQVDLVVPASIVRHLAKKSLVVQQR